MRKLILLTGAFSILASLPVFNASSSQPIPDPYFAQQWYLHNTGNQSIPISIDSLHTYQQMGIAGVDIGWLEAQPEVALHAKRAVTVAVIDSGIDAKHPDLSGRISLEGCDFLANPNGCDSKTGTSDLLDDVGHGTHVSGIIVANTGNGVGISGLAPPSVTVLPLKILNRDFTQFTYKGRFISDYAASAIRYAVAHHAKVINMSLGWPSLADTLNARNAVREAVAAGVLVVVAAGNNRSDQPAYPCDYEDVLCVGSVSNTGKIARYSNLGGRVDILGPGDGILSTYPLKVDSRTLRIQGYEILSGTSQATPLVAGIAAVLLSANPDLSLDELKARILGSSSTFLASSLPSSPASGKALYGMPNLKKALESTPSSVYLPNFKSLGEVAVNDQSLENLEIKGEIPVKLLGQDAKKVHIEANVNGSPAGLIEASTLLKGKSLNVPWKFRFQSLEDSSDLQLTLKVSDQSGASANFSVHLSSSRSLSTIAKQVILPVPQGSGGATPSWIGNINGHQYTTLNLVDSYGPQIGLPQYYKVLTTNNEGVTIQIFDPAQTDSVRSLTIPGIDSVSQVMRLDVNGDGQLDWIVMGTGKGLAYFQFYFLNPALQPLWTTGSVWQYPRDSYLGQVRRNYAMPGSWVKSPSGQLMPCFLGAGLLPALDGFDEFDIRHYQSDSHFFYLEPESKGASSASGLTLLRIRALDGADFRRNFPKLRLHTLAPPSLLDMKSGHLRILTVTGEGLNAPSQIWDIRSLADSNFVAAPGWDGFSSSGRAVTALPGRSGALISFFDAERGSIAWSDSEGQWTGASQFSFKGPSNFISNLIGVFNLGAAGKFWFLETSFDLAAYYQPSESARPVVLKTIPIQRDSSFSQQTFSELFATVLVGTADHPTPAVYIDSTLVQGKHVALAVWNPLTQAFYKPLRYSLLIPENCVQMAPFQMTEAQGSFGLPLFCQENGRMNFRIVQPE